MQNSNDIEHLRLLKIFYYIMAGFTAVMCLMPVFHLIAGIGLIIASLESSKGPPVFVGFLFIGIAIFMMIMFLVFALLYYWTAKSLSERKNYTFCFVIACISCISFPLGTALGVFTLIVLQRNSVKAMFGKNVPGFQQDESVPEVKG